MNIIKEHIECDCSRMRRIGYMVDVGINNAEAAEEILARAESNQIHFIDEVADRFY